MSPIEIAKAFNAPISRQVDSNTEAEQLIQSLGELDVRYGLVSTRNGNDEPKHGFLYAETDVSGRRLEIALPPLVTRPEKGYGFTE